MMTDESIENSDEEFDVLSILTNQSEEAEDDYEDELDEEVDLDTDMPEDVEGLKALLQKEREIVNKRNVSLRKSKAANKRILEEKGSLESRFDLLEEKINKPNESVSGEAERQRLAQEAQAWSERIEDDPTQAVGYIDWKQEALEKRIGSYLENSTRVMLERLDGLSKRTDPEMVKHQSTIDKLKSSTQFAGLDDTALLTIAKSVDGVKVGPRGAVGGKPKLDTKQADPNESVLTAEQKLAMGF